MTIKKKLFIGGLLLLVALSSIGLATGLRLRDRQQAQVRRTVGAIADLERMRIISELDAVDDRLQLTIRSEGLAPFVDSWQATSSKDATTQIRDSLRKMTPYLGTVKALSITDSDGTVIADSGVAGRAYAPQTTSPADIAAGVAAIRDGARMRVVGAYPIGDGEARFVHVMPIDDDAGTAVGYIVAECDLSAIQGLTNGSFVLGETAETSLVQRTATGGTVINQLRVGDHPPFSVHIPASARRSPAALALDGESISYHHLVDYRGEQVIAAVRRIPNTPWGLVVKFDEDEAYAGVERVLRSGAIGFTVAGSIAMVSLVLSFGSIIRRVRKVAASAEALSDGDLTARVTDSSNDELGRLARSFNTMADTLVSDMQARREVEAELAHSARHDPLTNLPNRPAFDLALTKALREETTPGTVAVLFCDLDDFKTVNDDLGHSAGDTLLREVTSRLRGATGRQNMLARFGGDEFVVVAKGLASPEAAVQLGERMAEALAAPVTLAGREVFVTTSVGVAVSRAGSTAETLVRDADAAMYQAKDIGRNRVVAHTASIGARTNNRLAMGSELQRAITHRGLTMALQTIIDLETNEIHAFEALVRWVHEGREVDPSEFVLRATEMDLAGALDRWVLDEACRTMALIDPTKLAPHGWLHVNVTGTSLLDDTFADDVLSVTRRHGVVPSALCLEIVEDRLGGAPAIALRNLARLRREGVRVAIDDFGTGHSSLARLRDLPADTVKIDQSFVRELATDSTALAITASIVSLARRLGLEVIAEGIETVEQRDALLEIGCRYGQGFLLGFPFPAGEVVERFAVR